MVMKTGREWLLVESSKLQDHRQWNCVIRNVTVESVRSQRENERRHERAVVADTGIQRSLSDKMVRHGGDTCRRGLLKFESRVSSFKNGRIRCFLLIQLKLETRVLILETRDSIG